MASKRSGSLSPAMRRKRTALTLELKLEILKRAEAGEGSSALGRAFNLGESTVRNIKKNAERIRSAARHSTPLSAKKSTKIRSPVIERMEKMLIAYIEDDQNNVNLTNAQIRGKALRIYARLSEKEGCAEEPFIASKGWFDKFIRRQNLLKVTEETSADYAAASRFPDELKAIIDSEGYSPMQVFNADEIGFYWKRMPSRTYISREERAWTGYKPANDKLTLLLCGNAAGDCKLKPLLVYRSLNPRALRGLSKNMLPVHWTANKRAWVTGQVFEDWFINHFIVETERYCREAYLPFKVLLILNPAPGHPKHLENINPNVSILFLPPDTSSLIQPLDQGVIATFKAYYLRNVISRLLDDTDGPDKPTVREWWKAFSVKNAIDIVYASWDEVKPSTMNCAWKSLWKECVNDFKGLPKFCTTVQCIVELGHQVGGEGFSDLEEADVMRHIDSHDEQLSLEDIRELAAAADKEDEEQKLVLEVKDLSREKLASFLSQADALAKTAVDMDPSLERSLLFKRGLTSVLAPYREVYARLMKQSTLMLFSDDVPVPQSPDAILPMPPPSDMESDSDYF